MYTAEHDVLAYMGFPDAHRTKLHSTNPIERLNSEVKRRTEVVGIFPNEDAITRLVGAILMEQSEEWAVQRARYLTLETMAPASTTVVTLRAASGGGTRRSRKHGHGAGRGRQDAGGQQADPGGRAQAPRGLARARSEARPKGRAPRSRPE